MKGTIHKSGDEIGSRYRIENYIGAGGMQEVYLATDTVLGRRVAIKAPKNVAAERRFKRSATLSARLNHPNVAKTLDYVEDGGRPYLVEEFVDGRDLHKVREQFPLMDPYLVAHMMHHIAKGVAASHHVDVVHRDLKPGNIMASNGVGFETVKVTDFGIAKMAEAELADAVAGGEETITGSHTMMGALPYLAPEMIQGPADADKPADIWAVGAIAYELLTGEKPFEKNLLAVEKILKSPPPPIPTMLASNAQFAGLLNEVSGIIFRCLEKSEGARPTADQLVGLCSGLCYPTVGRMEGTVEKYLYARCGFIASNGRTVFFHVDSVYGPRPSVGSPVCFAEFPGDPRGRAHPVLLIR